MTTRNDPTVSIVTFTGHATVACHEQQYAGRLLAFTKNTRLAMTPDGFDAWLKKPWSEIEKELEYMANTIPSAWEMIEVVFSIQNVSRACAQQITRTRNASYQMQSQRVTDLGSVTFHIPDNVKDTTSYKADLHRSLMNYKRAVDAGETLEDARGLLPINVHCNLVAKYNLRSLVELLRARDSLRVQGEYRDVAEQMKKQVLRIWPWSAPFFVSPYDKAIKLMEGVASHLTGEDKMQLAKAADLLKK